MKYLITALMLLSATVFANPIPLEHFTKHGDYLNMELSPDGQHIMARIRLDGKVNLVFIDTKSMEIVGGIRPTEGDVIHSVEWVSNDRVIYEFARDTARSDQVQSDGTVYATDVDGGKRRILYGMFAAEKQTGSNLRKRKATNASAVVISTLENDEDNILILEHPWSQRGNTWYDDRKKNPTITRLDVNTGKKRELEILPYPGAHALATKDGEVNFIRWRDDQNNFHAAYRENADAPWEDVQEKFGFSGEIIPFGQKEDGKELYMWASSGDDELRTPYALNLENGELTPLFTDHTADIRSVTVDSKTGMPVVGYSYPDKVNYHYVDGNKTAKLHAMLVDAFGGQQVKIASQTQDGKLLLVHVSSDVNPGEYYMFDTVKMGAEFLWANRSWLDPNQMANMHPISFKADDGMTIHGYLTLPSGYKEGDKPPMVTMVHGGPHGVRDNWGFDGETQFLANRGYAVLQVNYRGSAGYGDAYERAGYRNWGSKMISDITQGTQYVVDQGLADPERLCIYGASYGGYAALMAPVREPDMFKCAVGYVGLYNLEYAYTDSDLLDVFGGKAYLNDVIGTDEAELAANSPVNFADKIKANVMLIHGEKDSRVSVQNAEDMLEAFEKVGKKVPYLNFSKSGHGVVDEEGRVQLYSEMEKFLDQNIGK